MADDDALNRAKRALAVIPRGGNDALNRAKRALAPVDTSVKLDGLLARARDAARPNPTPAVIAKDASRVEDLMTRAKAAARPVEPKPVPYPATNAEPAPEQYAVPAPIERTSLPAAQPEPMPGLAPSGVAPVVQQTIIVQVEAPPPAYPYWPPYPYWAGCPRWFCPLRSGLPCRRWGCW